MTDREAALLNALRARIGAGLGHEGIMELITLLQNTGFFSKGGLAYLLGEK